MAFIAEHYTLILLLATAGCLAGFLAGLFGIGGGLVVVPTVYFVLQTLGVTEPLAIAVAIATSLATIVPTAAASARAHHRLGHVDWLVVRRLLLPLAIGVLVGSQLVAHVRSPFFIAFFAVFLVLVALRTLFHRQPEAVAARWPSVAVQGVVAALVGCVSAIAGVGGGTLGVPLLTAAGLSIHRAIGTSAAFGLFIALVGAGGILATAATPAAAPPGTWRLVYWPGLVVLIPLTLVMAPAGAKLAHRLKRRLLNRLFAGLLLVVAARMLYAAASA